MDQSVTGAGSANFSEFYQGVNKPSSGNSATVQQSAVDGAMNSASTRQDGNSNIAQTQQNTSGTGAGSGSVMLTMPTFTFTGSTGAKSILAASAATLSPGTFTSVIEQDGDSNQAYVSQGYWDDDASKGTDYSYVSQHGSSANAEVNQGTLLGGSINWSAVNQAAPGIAQINQDGKAGSSNISFLDQPAPAINTTITQWARGGDNASYASQAGGTLNISQTAYKGHNNSAIWQTDGTGATTVTQTVNNNSSISGSNDSTIWQSGVSNTVSVSQTVAAGGGGAAIYQTSCKPPAVIQSRRPQIEAITRQ